MDIQLKTLRLLLLAIVLFGMGFLTTQARAQSHSKQTILAMMEQRDRDIKRDIKPLLNKSASDEQRKQVENLINDIIDFKEMGRLSLGPHWNGLTAAQQKAFVDVFGSIVRSQSLQDLDIYNSKVTYQSVDLKGDSAYVKTLTAYKDKQTRVDYVLGYRNKAWHVDDIILDDVSTVEGYARSFQAVVRKKGFDALMKSLQTKLAKIQKS